MEKNKINLFTNPGCLSREAIIAFRAESLSADEITLVKKHLEECDLCRDAMEGFSSLSPSDLRKNFSDLNNAMQYKIIFSKKKAVSRKLKLSLAAAVFLALVGIFTVFQLSSLKEINRVAQELTTDIPHPKNPVITSNDKVAVTPQQAPVLTKSHEKINEKEKVQARKVTPTDKTTREAAVSENQINKETEPTPADEKKEDVAEAVKEDEVVGYAAQPSAMAKRSKAANTREVRYEEKSISAGHNDNSETTFYVVDEQAIFEGGDLNKFKAWVEDRLNAATLNHEANPGLLTITFTVDKAGLVKDAFVVKGLDPKTDSTAVTIVKGSPRWKPAKQQGKTVNVNLTLPLRIKS